jgi:carbamoyltransferase
MSPMRPENKDIINARVKFREAFRPFCPSILAEDAPSYLDKYRPEAFMITSFDVAADKRHLLPAVVHADGTLRPQCVEASVNPLYWRLISEFKRLTGVPALLNTSLNIKGEPMIAPGGYPVFLRLRHGLPGARVVPDREAGRGLKARLHDSSSFAAQNA